MERVDWYSNRGVLFEIVRQLHGREAVFLDTKLSDSPSPAVRMMKAHCIAYLQSTFKAFNFLDKNYNIYYSLLHFNNLPCVTYNLKLRGKVCGHITDALNKEYESGEYHYISGIDFGMDIDSESSISEAKRAALLVNGLMLRFCVPFTVRFSGNAGFHFNIDSAYFFPELSISERYERLIDLNELFKLELGDNGQYIDLAGVSNFRRVMKCNYNYDVLTGLIALPLDDFQLVNFKPCFCRPENVLRLPGFGYRGNLERFKHLPLNEKINNVKNLYDFLRLKNVIEK